MEKKIYLLILFLVALLTFSCTKIEDTQDSFQSTKTKAIDDCPVISSLEELNNLFFKKSDYNEMQLSPEMEQPIPFQAIPPSFGYKYTRKSKFMKEQKAIFDKQFADMLGVEAGVVYLVSIDRCELDVNTKGKRFVSCASPNCGAKPIIDTDTGVESSSFESLGYRLVTKGNPTVLSTHVYYIAGTFGGAALRKYYPRSPDNLEWEYILF